MGTRIRAPEELKALLKQKAESGEVLDVKEFVDEELYHVDMLLRELAMEFGEDGSPIYLQFCLDSRRTILNHLVYGATGYYD